MYGVGPLLVAEAAGPRGNRGAPWCQHAPRAPVGRRAAHPIPEVGSPIEVRSVGDRRVARWLPRPAADGVAPAQYCCSVEEPARGSCGPGSVSQRTERRLNSPPTEEEPWAGAAPSETFASCRQVATRRGISTHVRASTSRSADVRDHRRREPLARGDRGADRSRRVGRPTSGCHHADGYARTLGSSPAPVSARGTVELYRSLLDRHLIPALGDRQLGKLYCAGRPALVRVSCFATQAPSTVTVAKCYRLLRAILNTAVTDELIVRNPCAIKGAGVERTPERPVATIAQVWALADAVEPRFRTLVLTAAFAGLRFGELAALTRARVDLAACTISVVESQLELSGGVLLIGPPKSEAGRRTIVIPDALVPELTAHLDGIHRARGRRPRVHRREGCADPPAQLVGQVGGRRPRRSVSPVSASTICGTPATPSRRPPARDARELMHRMGHASAAAALRYQHATRDRDFVIARALNEVIEAGRV